MSNAIAFVHMKGGTGKTTSCINIAGWLAKWGKKVLVVDLDPQANATSGLGIDLNGVEHSVSDVLFGGGRLEDAVLETSSGVHLIPSSTDLLGADAQMSGADDYGLLAASLETVAGHYEYILIDASPGSIPLMTNAIVAARNIIIPFDQGVFAYETLAALKRLMVEISEDLGLDANILFLLLREEPALGLSLFRRAKTAALIEGFFTRNCCEAIKMFPIPYSTKVFEAQVKGAPLSHCAPMSAVGRAYKRVAQEVMKTFEG